MTDTITRLLEAVAQRDKRQFPAMPDAEDYARHYVLEMLRDLLRHDPDLDAYFEERIALVNGDLQAAQDWTHDE